MFTGSGRVISHDTFTELSWRRDPFCLSLFQIPPGFEAHADFLGNDFLAIIEDIKALQTIRDTVEVDHHDTISLMHLDNHMASIESRLYNLGMGPLRYEQPTLYCCILSAYLCTYALFTVVWDSSLLPSYMTAWLLENLRLGSVQAEANEHWDLFTWVICVGGTFAKLGDEQMQYASLLRNHLKTHASVLESTDLHEILQNFVWSERNFGKKWADFVALVQIDGEIS